MRECTQKAPCEKTMMYVSFEDYVNEILRTAEYKRDSETACVVAIARTLQGCMTQGGNFEEARDNLIDAIELWITVGLREGEEMPAINGRELATAVERPEERGETGWKSDIRGVCERDLEAGQHLC